MHTRSTVLRLLLAFLAIVLLAVAAPASAFNPDTRVSSGSQASPFAQNKQNEPAVAINPIAPTVLAAGANDEIDLEACAAGDPTTCPFTPGVGVSGIYFSFDGGTTWTQPTYTGWTARDCVGPAECAPGMGSIGTLPWYYENGLASDGDPALAFGPKPGADGSFSWTNGSRLYYTNLAANFSDQRKEGTFKGFEAIAVSRTDDVAGAAAGNKNAWMPPVIASRQNSALFSDKEAIWVDNAASSPFFGNVYIANVAFRSAGQGGAPEPVMFSRSTDGGDTWTSRQITQAANAVSAGKAGGRQGATIRTDSKGTVYVFWNGGLMSQDALYMARSFDGGKNFEQGRAVASIVEVGNLDPVQGRYTFDGVAGARTDSFPSVDIANGAPTGTGAPDTIVMTWADARNGLNHEQALVQYSTDRGKTWSTPVNAAEGSDRPNFPAIAISPDGTDLYLIYNAFLAPWQESTSGARPMQGIVRHADFSSTLAWNTLLRGAVGDARGSSANSLTSEFLGDYNYIAATNDFGVAVWNDVRNASDCPAIDAYRQSLTGSSPIPAPAPGSVCPATFGNSDIFGGSYPDPTP